METVLRNEAKVKGYGDMSLVAEPKHEHGTFMCSAVCFITADICPARGDCVHLPIKSVRRWIIFRYRLGIDGAYGDRISREGARYKHIV